MGQLLILWGRTGLFTAWYKMCWALSPGFLSLAHWAVTSHQGPRGSELACHVDAQAVCCVWIINCHALTHWVSLSILGICGVMARQPDALCLFWSLVTFCNSQQRLEFFPDKGYLQKDIYSKHHTIVKC